jgi:hypothetical protein
MIDPNLAQELALIVEYGKLRKPSMSVATDPMTCCTSRAFEYI